MASYTNHGKHSRGNSRPPVRYDISPPNVQQNYPSDKCSPDESTAYNSTELLAALKSIQLVVQCNSCHKSLNSARTCLNGHGICWNCKNRCNRMCPMCNTVILDAKPTMLNEIIKLLPRSCKFATKGCNSVVLVNDNDHETFCRFRNTVCRFPSCGWKGMVKDLLLHLENLHGKEMIRTATQTSILMSFNTSIDREGLAVIVAFNNIFWQHVRVRQNRLMQFYQYVPMEKPSKTFTVAIKFFTPMAKYENTTPVHTDAFDPGQLFKDQETFSLPKKIAISFNRFHSGVHYTFEIIQKNI